MKDLATRRDQIDIVKTVFLILKLVMMAVVATLSTLQLLYIQYAAPYIEKGRESELSTEGFLKYFEEPANMLLSVSYGICSFLAIAFVVFLILHGIQTLVVRSMQNA